MLKMFKAVGTHVEELDDICPGTLVRLVKPTEDEIQAVASSFEGVDVDDLRVALDDEEPSRYESNDYYTLLVVDAPVPERHELANGYQTYPIAIIVADNDVVVTTSLVDFNVSADEGSTLPMAYSQSRKVTVSHGKPRYVFDLFMAIAATYQKYLRNIEARRSALVERLDSRSATDLVALHGLETDIVYLETSLAANHAVLDRMSRSRRLIVDDDDRALYEDLLIEIRQAEEMAGIYKQLITSTSDLFSNVMDNSLNVTMKWLAAITIILSIPTIISGLYGMNVAPESMPLSMSPHGFFTIIGICVVICILTTIWLRRKDML